MLLRNTLISYSSHITYVANKSVNCELGRTQLRAQLCSEPGGIGDMCKMTLLLQLPFALSLLLPQHIGGQLLVQTQLRSFGRHGSNDARTLGQFQGRDCALLSELSANATGANEGKVDALGNREETEAQKKTHQAADIGCEKDKSRKGITFVIQSLAAVYSHRKSDMPMNSVCLFARNVCSL